jgi:hypothetical protein
VRLGVRHDALCRSRAGSRCCRRRHGHSTTLARSALSSPAPELLCLLLICLPQLLVFLLHSGNPTDRPTHCLSCLPIAICPCCPWRKTNVLPSRPPLSPNMKRLSFNALLGAICCDRARAHHAKPRDFCLPPCLQLLSPTRCLVQQRFGRRG